MDTGRPVGTGDVPLQMRGPRRAGTRMCVCGSPNTQAKPSPMSYDLVLFNQQETRIRTRELGPPVQKRKPDCQCKKHPNYPENKPLCWQPEGQLPGTSQQKPGSSSRYRAQI